MVKTVFICFIHGFKGNEETFFQFPNDLKNIVSEKFPDLQVCTAVYPKYDANDLAQCVETFKDWLQDQVTDLERKAGTPQAIQNPSVSVILVAHSMGGLVAADAIFSVLDNCPISSDPSIKLMFPLIQGLMAFDTPYNGLSRSMFAYGAFSQYQNISSIWNVGSSVGALLAGAGARTVTGAGARAAATNQLAASQPASWKRWQLLAARTGTYGAVIAGGVAAYVNRKEIAEALSNVNKESLSASWSKVNSANIYEGLSQVPAYVSRESIGEGYAWVASHLKFVGALMRPAQLKIRLDRLGQLKGIGVVDFYTSLGENGYWTGGYFVPKRTFCAVPKEEADGAHLFREQPNVEASDEVAAHCSMFRPEKNKKYQELSEKAAALIAEWLKNDSRSVEDTYQPSQSQRQRSMSEIQLWNDDGKVLVQTEEVAKIVDEDESQLQAILDASGMPEPKDGGVSDEDLERAAQLPLPKEDVDEEDMKKLWDGDGGKDSATTWRSRLANPLTRMSMPSMPTMPSFPSVPSVPSMPTIPPIPSWRKYVPQGKDKEDDSNVPLKRKAEDAFPDEVAKQGEDSEITMNEQPTDIKTLQGNGKTGEATEGKDIVESKNLESGVTPQVEKMDVKDQEYFPGEVSPKKEDVRGDAPVSIAI